MSYRDQMIPFDTQVYVPQSEARKEIHEWAEAHDLYSRSYSDSRFPANLSRFSKCVDCHLWIDEDHAVPDNLSCSSCGYVLINCPCCNKEIGYSGEEANDLKYDRAQIVKRRNLIVVSGRKIKMGKRGFKRSYPLLLQPFEVKDLSDEDRYIYKDSEVRKAKLAALERRFYI